jgi:hypothetical protein
VALLRHSVIAVGLLLLRAGASSVGPADLFSARLTAPSQPDVMLTVGVDEPVITLVDEKPDLPVWS